MRPSLHDDHLEAVGAELLEKLGLDVDDVALRIEFVQSFLPSETNKDYDGLRDLKLVDVVALLLKLIAPDDKTNPAQFIYDLGSAPLAVLYFNERVGDPAETIEMGGPTYFANAVYCAMDIFNDMTAGDLAAVRYLNFYSKAMGGELGVTCACRDGSVGCCRVKRLVSMTRALHEVSRERLDQGNPLLNCAGKDLTNTASLDVAECYSGAKSLELKRSLFDGRRSPDQ